MCRANFVLLSLEGVRIRPSQPTSPTFWRFAFEELVVRPSTLRHLLGESYFQENVELRWLLPCVFGGVVINRPFLNPRDRNVLKLRVETELYVFKLSALHIRQPFNWQRGVEVTRKGLIFTRHSLWYSSPSHDLNESLSHCCMLAPMLMSRFEFLSR